MPEHGQSDTSYVAGDTEQQLRGYCADAASREAGTFDGRDEELVHLAACLQDS